MSDLTTWLLAQLDAEAEPARAAIGQVPDPGRVGEPGRWPNPCQHAPLHRPPSHDLCARLDGPDITIYDEGGHTPEQAIHIARQDPQATLDRVEATKLLVAMHDGVHPCRVGERAARMYGDGEPCPTLRALAYAYRRQPGWESQWVPDEVTADA